MIRFPAAKQLLINLFMPFYVLYISLWCVFCLPKEKNGMRNKKHVSDMNAHKRVAVSTDIPI